MNAYSLKPTLVTIGFIVTIVFGVLGILACGTIGSACQSEEAQKMQSFAFTIGIPALLVSVLLLFLPYSLFGSTEKTMN